MATEVAGAAPAAGISRRQLTWLLGGLMMGLFLSATEQSVIATALPTMAGDLGGASNGSSWVVSVLPARPRPWSPRSTASCRTSSAGAIVYQTSIVMFIVRLAAVRRWPRP